MCLLDFPDIKKGVEFQCGEIEPMTFVSTPCSFHQFLSIFPKRNVNLQPAARTHEARQSQISIRLRPQPQNWCEGMGRYVKLEGKLLFSVSLRQ